MKAEWNASELRELHGMGFSQIREGDVYGTYSVVVWKHYNEFDRVHGGFPTEEAAQTFIDEQNLQRPYDAEIREIWSLERQLEGYIQRKQRAIVPHYTLDELMAFRDNPDTLAQAIEAIQTKQANIPIPKLITQWMEYEYARMGRVTP